MILFKSNNLDIGARQLRQLTINLLNYNIRKLEKDNSLGLKQLKNIYSISDIINTFNTISIDSNGNILIPENNSSNHILRYLEYGGEGVRATHLLSSVKRDLFNIFGGETNVFEL